MDEIDNKLNQELMKKLEKQCNKFDKMTTEQNDFFAKKAQERMIREKIAKIESSNKSKRDDKPVKSPIDLFAALRP